MRKSTTGEMILCGTTAGVSAEKSRPQVLGGEGRGREKARVMAGVERG